MVPIAGPADLNPLASPQRDTKGGETFEKYEYQYHWALCRVLTAHETLPDYVIFVEHHEDVVLANSTDEKVARFEFSQVKNVASSYTVNKLIARPGKKGAKKNSVLGKMLIGVNGQPFRDQIDDLSLVATSGFGLALKKKGLTLSVISVGELHDDCLDEIHKSLADEIGPGHKLPDVLSFVRPDLQGTGFQDSTIGRISKLVSSKLPGSKCDAQYIYRSLIDDLHRKGMVTFDFSKWSALVKTKGLTYMDVEKVISAHSEIKSIDHMMQDFDDIVKEKGLHYNQKIRLRRAFERYHSTMYLERTLLAMDVKEGVKKTVDELYSLFEQDGAAEFLRLALLRLPPEVTTNLADPATAEAALIYELILKNHEL